MEEEYNKYECEVCHYVYDEKTGDPDNNVEPRTKFDDIPQDWVCPLCAVGKKYFKKVEG